MGAFFQGWSRKVGCMAVALAVLLGLLWVRSHFYYELIEIATPRRTQVSIFNTDGAVLIIFRWVTKSDPADAPWPRQSFDWIHRSETFHSLQAKFIPKFSWGGRGGEGGPDGQFSTEDMAITIPYLSASLIVAAIAAYLLLWPGKRPATNSAPSVN